MDIRISRDSEVPIYEQLVEEITFSIATGELKPGDGLPSVKAMARRLKIHHNTVSRAYQELVRRTLLVRRRGSRMVVRSPGELERPPKVKDLDDLIHEAVQTARKHGYTFQQLRQRVQERLSAEPPDHVLVVSADSGMAHLIQEELKRETPFLVESCNMPELLANHGLATGALLVGPPGAIAKATSVLPKDHPSMPITFSPADEIVQVIRNFAQPSMIAVVSISELFLHTARGVLAPVVGSRHGLREYLLPSESPGDLGVYDLVISDSIAARRVKSEKLATYRVVSRASLEELSQAIKLQDV